MREHQSVIVLFVAAALCAGALCAQETEIGARGFAPERVYDIGDIDTVNLFNGNLTLAIPIGQRYPVGGDLSYGLTLVYNSLVWDLSKRYDQEDDEEYTTPVPSVVSNAGLGWTLTLGMLIPPDSGTANDTDNWLYVGPDGGKHLFYDELHTGCTGCGDNSPETLYTRDSTYLRLRVVGADREIDFPDGTIHRFSLYPPGSGGGFWQLDEIRDRYGNALYVTYIYNGLTSQTWTLTDTHGRQHQIHFLFDNGLGFYVDRVELAAFGTSAPAVWDFVYDTSTGVAQCYKNTDPEDPIPGQLITLPLLTEIRFPDGTAYQAHSAGEPRYLTDCSADGLSGALTGLRLPTLGALEWSYGFYILPGGQKVEGWPGVKERRQLRSEGGVLGTWRYSNEIVYGPDPDPSNPGPVETRTYVVHAGAEGHCTKHYFYAKPFDWRYGLPFSATEEKRGSSLPPLFDLSTQVYATSAPGGGGTTAEWVCTGDPVRSTYVAYESDKDLAGGNDEEDLTNSNRRLFGSRIEYHDDGDRWAETESRHFDGFGHYRRTDTNGNFDGDNTRTFWTDFNPDRGEYDSRHGAADSFSMLSPTEPWVIRTFEAREVTDGGGDLREESSHCFDAEGFETVRRSFADRTSAGATDLVAVFRRVNPETGADDGNVEAESYYGGWANGAQQQIPTTADPCALDLSGLTPTYEIVHSYASGSLATSHYLGTDGQPMEFESVDRDIDPNTGLVSASRDVSGLETTFDYDALGRPTWDKPAPGHGAWTQRQYDAAAPGSTARLVVTRQPNGGGPALETTTFHFDDLGRLSRKYRHQPSGAQSRQVFNYHARGWKSAVSTVSVGPVVGWTRFTNYDPFGRPTTIEPPDGAGHSVELTYKGVRQIERKVKVATTAGGETDSTTTEIYDRHGRLIQVTEPSGPNGDPVVTNYGYDHADRLITVEIGGYDWRRFNLNGLGELASEYFRDGGGRTLFHGEYDARGHPGYTRGHKFDPTPPAVWDAGVRFAYDRAERVVEVRELTNLPWLPAPRVLKEFTYAKQNSGANYRRGKLYRAVRHNYLPTGEDREVSEVYAYLGTGGRVSFRATAVDGVSHFTQLFTWTELGELASTRYPTCNHTACAGFTERTQTFGYTQGLLAAVPGWAPTLTYHANALLAAVIHGNGVTETWDNDPNHMRRPRRIQAAAVSFDTGNYAYDGAGNIRAIGPDAYLYDPVSRLVSGTIQQGAKSQSYTYDEFGSLQTVTTTDENGTAFRDIDVIPTSNALRNRPDRPVDYDPVKNLTRWAEKGPSGAWLHDERYAWDALNMMVERKSALSGDLQHHLYTADDERIATADGDTVTWRLRDLGGKVVRAFGEDTATGAWTWTKDWIWGNGRLLGSETAGDGIRHYHPDHLGTPRAVTRADGTIASRHDYYPFGEEASSWTTEVMKFTGHERDYHGTGRTDLDYMHARYYSPGIGRFLSVDPADSADPKLPQSWNKYTYALNNPLRFVDPNGLEPLDATLLQFFNAFFDADFARVDIQTGLLAQAITGIAGAGGVTLGENIYLSPEAARDYEKRNRSAIRLVGHEMTHTLQYRHLGTQRFLGGYLQNYSFNRTSGDTRDQAYRNIILEDIAFRVGSVIGDFLRTNPEIQGKLESGQSLSQQDLQQIDSALGDAAKSGIFKTGFQFIQGFLVYIEPPPE